MNNNNNNNNFDKKGINDAPITATLEQSVAWSKGYNEALEKTNAKELLEALTTLLLKVDGYHPVKEIELAKENARILIQKSESN